MEAKSAEQQSIEYLQEKQKAVIDDMAQYQMYRFAIEALEEKENWNKAKESISISTTAEMDKLKDKIKGMSERDIEDTLKHLTKEKLYVLLRTYVFS